SGPANNWRWDEETRAITRALSAYQFPQASACFIQSVSDDMEGIMRLATSEAMLFKFGSGTGTDLSSLRSSQEKRSGGGKPSGPVGFMRVYDAIASVVKCVTGSTYIHTGIGMQPIGRLAETLPQGFTPVNGLWVATPDGHQLVSNIYVNPPAATIR